jgi:aminopeptidase
MHNDLSARLRAYANLVIKAGCNIQPGQELYLQAAADCLPFARLLVEEAYLAGAKHVTVSLHDEAISRLHYDHCALEEFQKVAEWAALRNNSMAREGAAILSITSEDPQAMQGIDPAKPMAAAVAAHAACKEFYDALDLGRIPWCIVGAASPAWAARVFPGEDADKAVTQLWDAILTTVRITGEGDPVAAWAAHRRSFEQRAAWLNAQHFDALHYTNALGTNLTVGLNPGSIWKGGGDVTVAGLPFFPNMPTEELFTTPDPARTNGIVHSALPLSHNGTLIDDFSLTFKDGRAVACTAKSGQDMLEALIAADKGASQLGEVALIPYDSPIRNTGLLFYNTLFDENASCHLAIGKGFPDCIEGGTEMSEDELKAAGVNDSAIHVDFMIGTADLNITGIKANGEETPIFQNGNWA